MDKSDIRIISLAVAVSCIALFAGGCRKSDQTRVGPETPSPTQPAATAQTTQTLAQQKALQPDPSEEESVASELQKWVKVSGLEREERRAFQQFCHFLAVRRRCDAEIASGRMTDKQAVAETQPLIDRLAAGGLNTENILLRLLEARRNLKRIEREATYCREDPEIFAAIVLWNMKSKKAIPLFMALSKNKEIAARAVFVRGIARIGDPTALSALKAFRAEETDPEVQAEAHAAIEAIEALATLTLKR